MAGKTEHYYLTTPIYYANAAPHLGHAYTSIAADIMARYQRLIGKQVNFLTGMDEHGQKIARAAEAAGQDPQVFVDNLAAPFKKLSEALELSNTDFIRTTEARHIAGAQKFWSAAAARGDIYKKSYSGLYCVACEQFYLEKDLTAEQTCPVHDKPVEELAEENYFFRLSRYSEALKKHFTDHPDFIFPIHRQKEMQQLLNDGLEDISISRSRAKLSWGIPVPGDAEQVMYVWFDALTNYVTAIGYGVDEDFFQTWWPADAHLMSKEINRFHSLLWPAMLMSAGLALPTKIVVHGWLTVDGQKMSKTTGNVVDPFVVAEKYGADVFRFFLFRELPFGNDGDFSFTKLEARYASDLQHDLGNLVQRTIAMSRKFCENATPSSAPNTEIDSNEFWAEYQKRMDNWEFQAALDFVWERVRGLNQLIDKEKPWELAKQNKIAEIHAVLYVVLESLRQIALAVQPFMPSTADKIFAALGYEYYESNLAKIGEWGLLKSGAPLAEPQAIFPPLNL